MENIMGNFVDSSVTACKDLQKYQKLFKIGQGTYGEVFKARDRKSKEFVAVKKILLDGETEGFPITAIREIKILQKVKHENVVNLIEVCCEEARGHSKIKYDFHLVFEFCDHDLAGLIGNFDINFSLGEIKMIMKHLLNGLFFLHNSKTKILHRDLKPANILITKDGILKLADFGLARAFSVTDGKVNRFTNGVTTLWYRPPEILLGNRNYGTPIDMWSSGCIMAEMWTRAPIMQGRSEQQQLAMISNLCGSINPDTVPGVEKLDLYNRLCLPKDRKRKVLGRLKDSVKDANALDLIDKLLNLNPGERIDSDTALMHDFFYSVPMPCPLEKEKLNKSNFALFSGRNRVQPKLQQVKNLYEDKVIQYCDRIF